LKPIPARIAYKDQQNECDLFKPRVTVARDVAGTGNGGGPSVVAPKVAEPRNPSDARAAFDNLFKK
jgi:hypothetical protein